MVTRRQRRRGERKVVVVVERQRQTTRTDQTVFSVLPANRFRWAADGFHKNRNLLLLFSSLKHPVMENCPQKSTRQPT